MLSFRRRKSDTPPEGRTALLVSLSILFATSLWFSINAHGEQDKDNGYAPTFWDRPGGDAPDKEVPGWLVNLGPTGARAIITGNSFIVRHVFKGSPADGRLKLDDEIVGVFGKPFAANYVPTGAYGYEGPIMEFGQAIETAEAKDGKLILNVTRGSKTEEVTINLEAIGAFSQTFPLNCKKSDLLRARALKYFVDHPEADGACNTRAAICLALLSSEDPKHRALAKQRIQQWATELPDDGTWTWPAAYQLITLSEYYLITKDPSVLPTMKLDVAHLEKIQYKLPVAFHERIPGKPLVVNGVTFDYDELKAAIQLYNGGFGHGSPGGYGPMQYTTILAVIGWQLAERSGLTVTPERMASALQYIHHGTNASGAIGYGSEFTFGGYAIEDPEAYMRSTGGERGVGKSGAALIAHKLAAEHPESLAYVDRYKQFYRSAYAGLHNGHAEGNLNIFWGFVGAGAADDPAVLRTVMDYFKPWINMSRCYDGSFVVQPNRNAGDDESYYRSSRYSVTATMALALGIGAPKLFIQGIQVSIPGVNPKALKGNLDIAYKAIVAKAYGAAERSLKSVRNDKKLSEADVAACDAMSAYIEDQFQKGLAQLEADEKRGDYFAVQAGLLKLKVRFGGLGIYKEKTKPFEENLRKDPGKAEAALGARYAKLMATFRATRKATVAKEVGKFAEKYPDSLYGKWAGEAAKAFATDGSIVDPSTAKPAAVTP